MYDAFTRTGRVSKRILYSTDNHRRKMKLEKYTTVRLPNKLFPMFVINEG